MHRIKASASDLKESLFFGDVRKFAQHLDSAWISKKKSSASVSNEDIDELEADVKAAGGLAMKISGAGGGGFAMIVSEPEKKQAIRAMLQQRSGEIFNFNFVDDGAVSWIM